MSGTSRDHDPVELARLEAAVASLRRLDREIFLANRVDALSYDEIAAVTGLTRKQVMRRMARALFEIVRFMHGKRPPWWRRWQW